MLPLAENLYSKSPALVEFWVSQNAISLSGLKSAGIVSETVFQSNAGTLDHLADILHQTSLFHFQHVTDKPYPMLKEVVVVDQSILLKTTLILANTL